MDSTADLKKARCCEYWADLLERLAAKEAARDVSMVWDVSQQLYEEAVSIFCKDLKTSDVLVKTVILSLSHGLIHLIPEDCFQIFDASCIFHSLKYNLPSLDAPLKEDVIRFFISKCKPLRTAIIEGKTLPESRKWLYQEGVLSPIIYRWLLFRRDMITPTLSLLELYIDDEQYEIVTALLEHLPPSKSNAFQKLIKFACKSNKPKIALLLLEKMKSFPINFLQNFIKWCDEEQLKEHLHALSPEKKGEFLHFCFCSPKPETRQRSIIATAILESGNIDPTKINLAEILKFFNYLISSDLSFLKKLLDIDVSLDFNLRTIFDDFKNKEKKIECVKLACILLENGASIDGLEVAYSGKGGTVVHAATELALQTSCFQILKLTCDKVEDISSCLYDERKMTPLHIAMKQTECSPVSLEICKYLCHEIKIDSCLKDCNGKIAEDYCRNEIDERLMIINEAKYSHPLALEEVQKEKILEKPAKKVCPKKERDKEVLPKLKTEQTPCQQTNNNPSQQTNNSPSTVILSPPPISEHDCIIEGSGDDVFKHLMQDLLSQDETYFVYKSKRQGAGATLENEVDSEDERKEDTEIQLEPEMEMKYDVFCSPRVKTFIETGDPKLVSRVISTMKRLACGETSVRLGRKMHSKITDTIFHGNVDSAKRVIWHRTVSYSPISRRHCEILVLLDVVLDHKKLNKAVKNAENWIKRGEEEGGKYAVKLTSEGTPSFYEESDDCDSSETVPLMMKDDYGAVPIYSLPEYALQAIRAGISRRLGLPLKLSREEHEIVYLHDDEKTIVNLSYQKGTILVVGRSGTGKTTCCLSRMWEEFRLYWEVVNDSNDPIIPRSIKLQAEVKMDPEKIEDVPETQKSTDGESTESYEPLDSSSREPFDESATDQEQSANVEQIVDCDHLNQVFVTKSPFLCREVKHRFFDLVSSHNLLQKHKDLEHKLPTSLNDVSFPLFVTSRDLLMLMDSTLQDRSFFHRKKGKLLDKIKNSEQAFNEEDIGLLNDTDDEDSDSEDESDTELVEENIADDNELISEKEVIEVTASLFQNLIWKKISSGQKKIDPILVWQEIKSFIKGSVTALKSEQGYLSKEEYISIAGNQFNRGREIEFGAHQAVIIPSKDTLVPESLKKALVFTVLEAKGLEFNDVLLYNFFSESKVNEKSWELVSAYTCIHVERSSEKISKKHDSTLKKYDESEHKSLNAELKCLYTALTRAKRNLWICDFSSHGKTQHPMYEYFLKKGLMRTFTLEDSGASFTAEGSTPEEWKKAGDYLMSKQLWKQAMVSYKRAQARDRIYQVLAFMEVEKQDFFKAAMYFLMADKVEHERKVVLKAAKCLRVTKFKCSKDEKRQYYSNIAKLFERLGKVNQAGEFYILAEDFDSFILMSELKKKYNRVVKQLLGHNQKILALRKAAEYKDKVTIKGFQINKLAYDCVRFYMSKGDSEAVREAIKHLESRILKAKYLEINCFYDDVIDLLIETGDYEEAFKLAWRHGLYIKAADITRRESGSQEKEAQFLLCEIYSNLHSASNLVAAQSILESLKNLTDRCSRQLIAQALLVEAKITCNTETCKKALEIFEELHNEGGVFESVNVLLTVCDKPNIPPEDILDYCLRAIRLSKVFGKTSKELSRAESGWISSYLMINQIQKLPNGQIFVPPSQGFWLPIQHSASDLTLLEKEVHARIQEHLQSCCVIWLRNSHAIKHTLSKYTLHKQVQQKGLIPTSAVSIFMRYLNRLSMIVELDVAINCYPESQNILSIMFSPLSVLHNHAWRRFQFQRLQTCVSITDCFKADFDKILKEQESCGFSSFDQCMQLWRLSLIVNSNTKFLHENLKKFVSPSQHAFLLWVNATYLLSAKHKVLKFIGMVNTMLSEIAFSHDIFRSISDENLLYIVIIQSLSSFYLISLAWRKNIFVPRIFESMMKNFNFLVQQSKYQYSLMKACVDESLENFRYSSDVGRFAISQLQKLLNLLLQIILPRVISNHDHTITRYYVILILTISVNLIIARPTLENESVHKNLILLVTNLDLTLNRTTKPPFAEKVFSNLIEATNLPQIFEIITYLLRDVKNVEIQLIFPSIQGNFLNFDTVRHPSFYPSIRLRQNLISNHQLIKQDQVLQEPEQEAEQEAEQDMEFIVLQESVTIQVQEQEGTFTSKLKENMIENGICKICNINIQNTSRSGMVGSKELDRQDSTENEYEAHIESDDHKRKKEEHNRFSTAMEKFEYQKSIILKEVQKLQKSPKLSPEDDIKLTQINHQISGVHAEIESIAHMTTTTWTMLIEIISSKIEELQDIHDELNKILGIDQKDEADNDEIADYAISSPIDDPDIMQELFRGKQKEKKKRK
uniref:UvrD-like helicase C-terminal domain-containing protein n=1 Tax=Amphimedon queenslandica TaxID=400682 RepID=A0A1X7VQV8_AMPQE